MAGAPQGLPSGEVSVAPPAGDSARAECLRDVKRTLGGGNVFIISRKQRHPVRQPAKALGDISREACDEAFGELSAAIAEELADTPSPESLEELARRVATHITVAPSMQVLLAHSLPPALWQPVFAICIGNGQVRVLTFAFVGTPVVGDRPSCKSTPFILQLRTDDLVAGGAPDGAASVRYAVHQAEECTTSILEHFDRLQQDLICATEVGEWGALDTRVQGLRCGGSASGAHLASPPAAGAAEQPLQSSPTVSSRHVGDRATRMRAALVQAQSPEKPTSGIARWFGVQTKPITAQSANELKSFVQAGIARAMSPSRVADGAPTGRPLGRGACAQDFGRHSGMSPRTAATDRRAHGYPSKPQRSAAGDGKPGSAQHHARPVASQQVVDRAARMRASIRAQATACSSADLAPRPMEAARALLMDEAASSYTLFCCTELSEAALHEIVP